MFFPNKDIYYFAVRETKIRGYRALKFRVLDESDNIFFYQKLGNQELLLAVTTTKNVQSAEKLHRLKKTK